MSEYTSSSEEPMGVQSDQVPKLDDELQRFIFGHQKKDRGRDFFHSSHAPQNASMLLKCTTALLWKEGHIIGDDLRQYTLIAIQNALEVLQTDSRMMSTSIAIASQGPELARLRVLTPIMNALATRCSEYASTFANNWELTKRAGVPDFLYQLSVFSRGEKERVDGKMAEEIDEREIFAKLSDYDDRIALVHQMFYELVDMLESYSEGYDEMKTMYESIEWAR